MGVTPIHRNIRNYPSHNRRPTIIRHWPPGGRNAGEILMRAGMWKIIDESCGGCWTLPELRLSNCPGNLARRFMKPSLGRCSVRNPGWLFFKLLTYLVGQLDSIHPDRSHPQTGRIDYQ